MNYEMKESVQPWWNCH